MPAPAQRVKVGTESPDVTGDLVTGFFTPDVNTSLSFFESGSNFFTASDLRPNDVMYIWIEREVKKGSPIFLNDDFVINIKYKVTI